MDSFFEAYPESARGSQRVHEGSNVLVLHQWKWLENRRHSKKRNLHRQHSIHMLYSIRRWKLVGKAIHPTVLLSILQVFRLRHCNANLNCCKEKLHSKTTTRILAHCSTCQLRHQNHPGKLTIFYNRWITRSIHRVTPSRTRQPYYRLCNISSHGTITLAGFRIHFNQHGSARGETAIQRNEPPLTHFLRKDTTIRTWPNLLRNKITYY
jgi:hypothetical protein